MPRLRGSSAINANVCVTCLPFLGAADLEALDYFEARLAVLAALAFMPE